MINDVSKIVENFLSSIEKKVLDLQLQVENLLAKNREYDEIERVIEALQESKINFSIDFLNKDTKEIVELLERVIPDKERINFYLAQITNYYYLYETDLLDKDVTKDQTGFAEQALSDLVEELKEYQSKIDVVKNRQIIKELNQLEERIIAFGSKFSYIEDQDEIIDLDLFTELMEDSRLAEEEKVALLKLVIMSNAKSYEKQLLAKDTDIKVAIEQKQEEVLAELEELTTESVVTTLDQETLDKINKLLSDPEVIRRLVKIIEDTQEIGISIEGRAIVEDQQDIVDEAVQIAREEIIELISDQKTETPEEALDIFMEENDDELFNAQVTFEELFGDEEKEPSDTNVDEYLELIQRGIEFYDQNKKLLLHMTTAEKESIDNYARSLYQNKNNRTIVYKSKNFDGNNKSIIRDATYEISTLLHMFEQLETNNKLTNDVIIKTGRRISEIIESIELSKENELDLPVDTKETTTQKGAIYFLEKGTSKNRTFYEDEIGIDSYSKGISSSYYKELLFQLEQIENRANVRIPSLKPNHSKTYPYTSEFGVRFISGTRTSTYFIPVGTDDAIIVGVRFIDTGDEYRKTLENRLKKHSARIEDLIEKINTAPDKEEARRIASEIKKILSQDDKDKSDTSEIDSMFTVPPVIIEPPKKL